MFIFKKGLSLFGIIDWSVDLVFFCVIDVVKYFNVSLLNEGELVEWCLSSVMFCVWEIYNMMYILKLGVLFVMLGDCGDVFVLCCLVVLNGIKLGVFLFIGGY